MIVPTALARALSVPRVLRMGVAALGVSGLLLATSAGAAFADGAGPTMIISGETRTVHVDATTAPIDGAPGVDTGVTLAPGQGLRITATGTATCHTPAPPAESVCGDLDADGDGEADSTFLAPDAPAYSLVGEVGTGPVSLIGTGPTIVDGSGELRLGYNDQTASWVDKSGGFDVTIQTCTIFVSVLGIKTCVVLG